jgi:alpha-glucosidase (family GH31 glycosyl hydrolase)
VLLPDLVISEISLAYIMGGRNQLRFPVSPIANTAATIVGQHYRFTVLTDGLLRYEWAPDSKFEDRPSVFAINRNQPTPEFRTKETASELEIITSRFHLTYDKTEFHPSGFSVAVKGLFSDHASVWRYSEDCENLGGTARTLDGADGRIPLGSGVVSRKGYTTIDDSASMLFDEDGFVASRLPGVGRVDGYLFAYGHDYRGAVKALYMISGSQPLLPRWVLGNWWSRYYAYRADEYLALMDKFQEEGIPLSVAVLDMDWHIVNDPRIAEAGQTGWTGYTWNKELFPDPPGFLSELHKKKLKTALNDHPADGVQSYEDLYEDMARALDHDASTKDPIHFDLTNRRFLNAFFDVLHRPHEVDGVDFWWIDWQQGEYSRIKGIDPLWMLNHFHFLDNGRDNKRPLIFSRYAGPGSHRYPVGFSGDTVVTWASLDFQPEFTITASNIGYGWWSHDIGGHWHGSKDDELGTRWVQFGVFSPILRLHSSKNQWMAKEPWKFGMEARKVMSDFLRLRHRLLPYLYTMNARAAQQWAPIVQPMYWDWPDSDEAYRVKNQYLFGSEMIVMPITAPQDLKLRSARVRGWLPPGRYVDIFNGAVYDGDRELWISRPLDGYPVFAKEGSIIPLDAALEPGNGGDNPEGLEVVIVVGADGEFEILEDDGNGSNVDEIKWSRTSIKYTQESGTLRIGPTHGGTGDRNWHLLFLALSKPKSLSVLIDGIEKNVDIEEASNGIFVTVGALSKNASIVVELGEMPQLRFTNPTSHIWPLLNEAQIGFGLKEDIWKIVTAKAQKTVQVSRLHALEMDSNLLDAVLEYMLADSRVEE